MNLQDLKKNIPYQWRVQSFTPKQAVCVAYIDSRDVQDLLDEVVSPENWQCDYKEIKGNMFCGIGILVGDRWIWKWDCGTESNTEKEKGEASDSFKRAAVKWGIGRFLYELEIQRIGFSVMNDKKYPTDDAGKILWSGEDLTKFINNKKNGTTLYNHKPAGNGVLPLISNEDFKNLCAEVKAGNLTNLQKYKEQFSFEETQQTLINQLYKQASKVKA